MSMAPGDAAVMPLEGGLTVYEAEALKQALMGALDAGHGLQLDLSGVAEIDGAGVQLLLSARREALRRGLPFAVRESSPVVREAFALLGPLRGASGLPAAEVRA